MDGYWRICSNGTNLRGAYKCRRTFIQASTRIRPCPSGFTLDLLFETGHKGSPKSARSNHVGVRSLSGTSFVPIISCLLATFTAAGQSSARASVVFHAKSQREFRMGETGLENWNIRVWSIYTNEVIQTRFACARPN